MYPSAVTAKLKTTKNILAKTRCDIHACYYKSISKPPFLESISVHPTFHRLQHEIKDFVQTDSASLCSGMETTFFDHECNTLNQATR